MSENTTDITTWVERVQRTGDVDAFRKLVERFEAMAFAVAHRRLGDAAWAEDACQDAFLAAYLDLGKLDDPAAFPGWFGRVVRTHAERIGRRRAPTPVARIEELPEARAPVERPHDDRADQARAALDALPERDRFVLELYHRSERPAHEVAAFLEMSLPLVKKTLRRARGALRQELEHMTRDTPKPEGIPERVAFYLHLRRGEHEAVGRMLLGQPALANASDLPDAEPARWYLPSWGRATPLLMAVAMGDEALCALLLRHGADIDLPGGHGMTPLHEAITTRRHAITALLLDHGADPSAPIPRSGMTPLHIAASRGDAATTRRLLRHGADPDAADLHKRTPRDWAALRGHHDLFDATTPDTTKGGAS
jgi:RNA polymerase sigma factor (sigma-70 family)